jgi:hypothetical protein
MALNRSGHGITSVCPEKRGFRNILKNNENYPLYRPYLAQ